MSSRLVPHIPDHPIILNTLCCFRFYVQKYDKERLNRWKMWSGKPQLLSPELWYVVDMATPDELKARGTRGHKTKRGAIAEAEEFRDEYGGYWSFPF